MLYILAIFIPLFAVLLRGSFGQFLFSILLSLLGWFPGTIYAFLLIALQDPDMVGYLPFEKVDKQAKTKKDTKEESRNVIEIE